MKKILLVGPACSGKTTLARRLSTLLLLPHIELDAMHWMPDWQELDSGEFREAVIRELQQDGWIVDGNYGRKLGKLVWQRADTIIWLNLPFTTVYYRLLRRSARRIYTRQELWNGNRETLTAALFQRDSLLYWIPENWNRIQTNYRAAFDELAFDKNLLEFKSADELECWFSKLNRTT
jgi:adenylate kinase family enzyme